MGEAVHALRQGGYGNSLYLPFNFAVNLKLLLKKCLTTKSRLFCKDRHFCVQEKKDFLPDVLGTWVKYMAFIISQIPPGIKSCPYLSYKNGESFTAKTRN